MAKVAILRKDKLNRYPLGKLVEEILDNVYPYFSFDVRSVLIKPNLMYYWGPSTGETTDPRVVSCIIDCLRKRLGDAVEIFIAESDASAMRTKYAFKVLGYDEISKKKDVMLVNLSEGDKVTKHVHLHKEMVKIEVNKLLLSVDFIVNVPKLKVHRNPPVLSCALKNFFGLISEPYKFQYHSRLSTYVVAINKLVKADLTIVDGLVALGSYPKKMGLLIGSTDPVACDIVAAKVAGINPKTDLIISKAIQEGLGGPNFQLIDPHSAFEKACRDFPRLNLFMTRVAWAIQLKLLRFYVRLSGDILPPVLMD